MSQVNSHLKLTFLTAEYVSATLSYSVMSRLS